MIVEAELRIPGSTGSRLEEPYCQNEEPCNVDSHA